MKIQKIRYANFRNFEKEGEITFSTDGKLTIIYGTNGDGKTTLHQLFQWILYGYVNFNKTTSADKLYNLAKGDRLTKECSMYVWGEIEFEHENEKYLVRREWEYYKKKTGAIIHKASGDEFYIQKQDEYKDWKIMEHPEAIIETVLPSGLAPYFFFDGETMIADLKMRGTDSAKTLKHALNSIFELEIYEKALIDIGNTSRSQSALGQLNTKKMEAMKKATSEATQKKYLTDIKILTDKIELIDNENTEYEERIKAYEKRIQEISEAIGTNKSKKQLEETRSYMLSQIDRHKKDIKSEMLRFGDEVANNYSYLLISEVVKNADTRLYMQVQDEKEKIIPGLTKELLINLLKNEKITKCICGHDLNKEELNNIEEWKSFFPPTSYKSTYDKFSRKAIIYSGKYDEERLFKYLKKILELKGVIRVTEQHIEELDKQLSETDDIDKLIDERRNKEKEILDLQEKISENDSLRGQFNQQKTVRERKTKTIGLASDEIMRINKKIGKLETVREAIKGLLSSETKEYSQMLKEEIQNLIDIMLTSKREVSLNEDFQLQVKDSYGDESKSEGQFAVVSFAYIGGILKVLKSHKKLASKDYPLILDGPFSKLNEEHKINVLSVIPQYAPQVVIFSKDSLENLVAKDRIGKVWTIVSNNEKNNAVVKEGFLWK